MKKVMLMFVIGMFMISFVFAEQGMSGQGSMDNGQDSEDNSGEGMQANVETSEMNQGEGSAVANQVRERVRSGEHMGEDGKQFRIEERDGGKLRIGTGEKFADCDSELREERVGNRTRLKAKLSNGRDAEVKIMPDRASERALERLRLKNCVELGGCKIELKEVGEGEGVRLAYEMKTERQARFLGLFKMKMNVEAQVNAEDGEIIRVKKPWWAFLASEPEE